MTTPIRLAPWTTYVASVHDPHGHYAVQANAFIHHRLLGNGTIAASLGGYRFSQTSACPLWPSAASYFVNVSFSPDPPSVWPDASNTGVPAGVALTPSGSINVSSAHLTNVEVNGNNLTTVTSCVGWGNYTATRVNLHNCPDGAAGQRQPSSPAVGTPLRQRMG